MNTIYKYQLDGPYTVLTLPVGARVLTAQLQGERLVVWALIDSSEIRTAVRHFAACNTGGSFEFPGKLDYLATATSENGVVWHVFEVVP